MMNSTFVNFLNERTYLVYLFMFAVVVFGRFVSRGISRDLEKQREKKRAINVGETRKMPERNGDKIKTSYKEKKDDLLFEKVAV